MMKEVCPTDMALQTEEWAEGEESATLSPSDGQSPDNGGTSLA